MPAILRNSPVDARSAQPFRARSRLTLRTPHNAVLEEEEEIVMFDVTEVSRNTQRAICMFMAAFIVSASLSLGAVGAQSMLHEVPYTVTVHE